jgi:hypothetical protein
MSRVFVLLVTVVLFAGFVLLTLPLAAGEWADRHLTRQPPPWRPLA